MLSGIQWRASKVKASCARKCHNLRLFLSIRFFFWVSILNAIQCDIFIVSLLYILVGSNDEYNKVLLLLVI